MSLVAKTVGGKRIDFSKGNGYQRRCQVAALAYNAGGPKWHSYFHHRKFFRSPGTPMRKTIKRREKQREAKKCRRTLRFTTEQPGGRPKFSCSTDKDYGPKSQQPDIDPIIYEAKKNEFLTSITISVAQQTQLEVSTRAQSECELWHEERRKRLSSTWFYDVSRKHTPKFQYPKLVRQILYSSKKNLPALEYDRTHEMNAITAYHDKNEKVNILKSGLFVCTEHPYLCASPDALLDADGLLEAKCPYSALKYHTILETSKKHSIGVKVCKKGCLCLPKTHRYYYQIQGQLHVTGRMFCDLVVWSPTDAFIQRIPKDTDFWKTIQPRLKEFYYGYLLPEIIDPRERRHMALRDAPFHNEF